MADHPLRPATDHCLGRPLPHQQANPTRAPPIAINLSPMITHRAHAVLAEVSLGYPPLLGRFPRATHPCATPHQGRSPDEAIDLHVLSMPPAFVLSQDQTLMFIPGGLPNPPHPTNPAQDWPFLKGRQTLEPRCNSASRQSRTYLCANVSDTHAAARASLPIPTMSINKPRRLRP